MGNIFSVNNLRNAISTAYFSFKRSFEDPASAHQQTNISEQIGQYNLLWAYYSGSMFDRGMLNMVGQWTNYKRNYRLYRNIRNIYNPARRLVDFYAANVYPGALSEDGSTLPDGVSLAIPLAQDTPEELKIAISQLWQWSNFQSLKSVMVRYGAALGNVLLEVVDDTPAGQVYIELQWPGNVTDLELDPTGNVLRYAIQYQVAERDWQSNSAGGNNQVNIKYYTYRKVVDTDAIYYFKNGLPFDYNGAGAVVPNLYGFVPAVWIKHTDVGGQFGSPAIAGSLGKIDELNNLSSHIHDQIHKVIGSPILIATESSATSGISNLFGKGKRGPNDNNPNDLANPEGETENLLMLKGPPGTTVASLAGNLPLADSLLYVTQLITEIESDHPELNFYKELRGMSQLTGPAAARIVGDVTGKLFESQANYDRGIISLFQMALSVAGFRANNGDWGSGLTQQQSKFLQFDLSSYSSGDLDFAIMPRPLLTPTKQEQASEHLAEAQAVAQYVTAKMPLETALEHVAGWSEDELAELQSAQEDQQSKAFEMAQKMAAIAPPAPPATTNQVSENENNNNNKGENNQNDGSTTNSVTKD